MKVEQLEDNKLYMRKGPNGIVMWATGKWWKEYMPFTEELKKRDDQILMWGQN